MRSMFAEKAQNCEEFELADAELRELSTSGMAFVSSVNEVPGPHGRNSWLSTNRNVRAKNCKPLTGICAGRHRASTGCCYVDVKSPNTRVLLIRFMGLFFPHSRETGCYWCHGTKAVTLTWDASLFRASGPGLSVSRIEPLGVISSGSARRRIVPGAQSPLGLKEPIEPFLSVHRVFVSSTLRKS
jgi:hypothetical protein